MILITRPKEESRLLRDKLEILGMDVATDILSRFRIRKNKKKWTTKKIFLISSPRAANIFINKKILNFQNAFLIIGKKSENKLTKAGYKNIIHTSINSEKMYHYLKNKFRNQTAYNFNNIVYLTSTVGNQNFQIKLDKIGIQKKIIYETFYKKNLNKKTITLIKKNKISACLVFSKNNANHLVELFNKHKLKKPAEKIIFISMSEDISKIFKKSGFKFSHHSKKPTQQDLINKLLKIKGVVKVPL